MLAEDAYPFQVVLTENAHLGGVTLEVMVPEQAFFDGKLRAHLPLILRKH